jgi:hypothetical protein
MKKPVLRQHKNARTIRKNPKFNPVAAFLVMAAAVGAGVWFIGSGLAASPTFNPSLSVSLHVLCANGINYVETDWQRDDSGGNNVFDVDNDANWGNGYLWDTIIPASSSFTLFEGLISTKSATPLALNSPNSTYYVRVYYPASNQWTRGTDSFKTAYCKLPSKVSLSGPSSVTQNSFGITWPLSPGTDTYDIYLNNQKKASVAGVAYNAASKSQTYTFSSLSCATAYSVYVIGINSNGTAKSNNTISTATAACPKSAPKTSPPSSPQKQVRQLSPVP